MRSHCWSGSKRKLKDYPANMPRAATELAKEWRMDRALRRLEAMIAVVDAQHTLLVSGTGDVIQPTDGILGIGSGGNYALAAARAWWPIRISRAAEIVRKSLEIAADICVYSNPNITVESFQRLGPALSDRRFEAKYPKCES